MAEPPNRCQCPEKMNMLQPLLTGKFLANKANRKRRKHEHGFGLFLAC
jgi:hypothetical protein